MCRASMLPRFALQLTQHCSPTAHATLQCYHSRNINRTAARTSNSAKQMQICLLSNIIFYLTFCPIDSQSPTSIFIPFCLIDSQSPISIFIPFCLIDSQSPNIIFITFCLIDSQSPNIIFIPFCLIDSQSPNIIFIPFCLIDSQSPNIIFIPSTMTLSASALNVCLLSAHKIITA